MAAQSITKPSKSSNPPRILVYSRNKKGKTKFAMSAGIEKTLIIDPEHGTDRFKKQDPNVWHISQWQDLQDIWGYLRLGDHGYDWIALDGLTKINNMALKYVMKIAEERDLDRQPGMVDRRDYNKSGELMKDLLTKFFNLTGVGVIFTSQERMKSMDSGDSDEEDESVFFVPDLPDGVRGFVNSLVDVIGRLYVVRVDIKGEMKPQRRLQIGAHERYDSGARSDFVLPDIVKWPTIPKLVELMETGSVSKKKG